MSKETDKMLITTKIILYEFDIREGRWTLQHTSDMYMRGFALELIMRAQQELKELRKL